ncbi:hypothetical protein M5X11_26215 [Paenibacillus alginolyticus]|uniref:Glutamine--fructose-6-phosphate aminotransferase [isomerizing] n=1 Tax=Paenibacillus alginolyticus TaxID=59839 RepID=A0ABT4GGL0_9BACL|nr:hypothetical protein [Paenibacillus alginolyticus]MCY9668376.1 hypothetical protein [Paenibacillus alginolyticus]MCY9695286.1 hypothetical protein [Paenibacillus alginolyticus]
MPVPETIDDWHMVLKAFIEKDPNGDGKNDEVPFSSVDTFYLNFADAWGIDLNTDSRWMQEFMGRGPSVTTADYDGLLLKETARMFTESLSVAQFRHGRFELVAEKFQCIFFNPPGPSYEANEAFAREIADQGGQVVYISNRAITHPTVSSITLVDAFNEFISPIIYVFFVQLIALEMSHRKGLVAGEAKLVGKVTGKE